MKLPLLLLFVAACGGGHPVPLADSAPAGGDAAPDDTAVVDDRDPATDGTFAVTTRDVPVPGAAAGRTLAATLYLPTGAPSPHALVVISPGFQMPRSQYASYAHHLATWGFVALLADYADQGFFADHEKLARDIPAAIDWALAQGDLAIDPQRLATAGHSLGGKLSVFAATLDPRIAAVVGWDPVDSQNPSVAPEKMGNLHAALAVIGETTDGTGGAMPCAPTADNFDAFYAAAHSPALAMTVATADHMDWVDDPSCAFCSLCTAGSAPPELARTATRRLDVAWLRRQLFGDAQMDHWLDAPPEVAAGTATIARR